MSNTLIKILITANVIALVIVGFAYEAVSFIVGSNQWPIEWRAGYVIVCLLTFAFANVIAVSVWQDKGGAE